MIKERNGWSVSDNDCMQCCKKKSETEFLFIQAVWLDSDNYAVCSAYIDLELYSENDMQGALSSYGYTMESANVTFGDSMNQIIAECLLFI